MKPGYRYQYPPYLYRTDTDIPHISHTDTDTDITHISHTESIPIPGTDTRYWYLYEKNWYESVSVRYGGYWYRYISFIAIF